MRILFPLLLLVLTLLCFEVTSSLDFLDVSSSSSTAKKTTKGLRGRKEDGATAATETTEATSATQTNGDQVSLLDVTVADEKVKAKKVRSSTEESAGAGGVLEEFNPEGEGKKKKTTHKKKSHEEGNATSEKKAEESIDQSSSAPVGNEKKTTSTSSTSKEERKQKKAAQTENVEFIDVSGAGSNVATTTTATKEKKSSSESTEQQQQTGEKKVEFVDLNNKEVSTTKDEAKPSAAAPIQKEETTAAAPAAATPEKKVEFIDLNASTDGTTSVKKDSAKPTDTTSTTTSSKTTTTAAAKDKVEFVDLNAADEKKPISSSSSSSQKGKKGSDEAVEMLDVNKKDEKKPSPKTSSDAVEMMDTTATTTTNTAAKKEKKSSSSSSSSSSGGFLDFFSSKKTKKSSEDETKKDADSSDAAAAATTIPTKQETVFITGINTAIATEVARQLLVDGDVKVVGLAASPLRTNAFADLTITAEQKKQFSIVNGDINDMIRLLDIVTEIKPTTVYHFAGLEDPLGTTTTSSTDAVNPQMIIQQNIQGTLNLLEAIRRAGLLSASLKFFYGGSSSEYGYSLDTATTDCEPIPENTRSAPRTIYGLSRYSSELLVQQYGQNYGLTVYLARFFSYFGPSVNVPLLNSSIDRHEVQSVMQKIVQMETGLLNIEEEIIEVHPTIQIQRDLLDVRDAATAALLIVSKGKAGEVYNVGSGEGVTVKSLLGKIVAASKVDAKALKVRVKKLPTSTADADGAKATVTDADKCAIADISRLKKMTGFSPKYSVATTIEDTLQSLRKDGNSTGGNKRNGSKSE